MSQEAIGVFPNLMHSPSLAAPYKPLNEQYLYTKQLPRPVETPKFIRNNLDIHDISKGDEMGQWVHDSQQKALVGSVPVFVQGRPVNDQMKTRTKDRYLGISSMLGRSNNIDRRIYRPNQDLNVTSTRQNNVLNNSDIPESQVGFKAKPAKPYNLLDYSDVSGKYAKSNISRRYNSPNMITDIKAAQIMPIQLYA